MHEQTYVEEAVVAHDEAAETVESLGEAISKLTAERQLLRARGAIAEDLELNRLDLIDLHRRLARALIERHVNAGSTVRPAA